MLWTSRTAKTSTEALVPTPRPLPLASSLRSTTPRLTTRNRIPEASPAATSPTDPSSKAGSSNPATDATAITPAARPHSAGRRASARRPRRKTGTAPRPVASAVAVPARTRVSKAGGWSREWPRTCSGSQPRRRPSPHPIRELDHQGRDIGVVLADPAVREDVAVLSGGDRLRVGLPARGKLAH